MRADPVYPHPMRSVSRQISDRRKLAERLRSKIGAWIEPIAEARAKLLAPGLAEGETLPDGELELELLLRLLDRRLAELEEAEEKYRVTLQKLNAARHRRNRAAKTMNREIQALRRKVDAAHGSGGAADILELTGRTRRRAQAIHGQARWVVVVLRGLDVGAKTDPEAAGAAPADAELEKDAATAAAGAAAAGVVAAEAAEWRKTVEPAFKQLDTRLDRTGKLEPAVDLLRFNRDLACGEFDHTARHLVAITKSYALLVKEERAVERIRRAARPQKRPGPKKKKPAAPEKEQEPQAEGSREGEPMA